MIDQKFKGYVLAAHPRRQEPVLRRGVILVIDHDDTGAIGLQINKPFTNDITFATVMHNVGLTTDIDQPLYNGGPESSNRIHVIHSLDWYSPTTIKVTDTIGVSNDVSVLTAISENEGPEHFRVVAGFARWLPKHLDGEIAGTDPWHITQSWSYAPADLETVFSGDDIDQWHTVIDKSSRLQTATWL